MFSTNLTSCFAKLFLVSPSLFFMYHDLLIYLAVCPSNPWRIWPKKWRFPGWVATGFPWFSPIYAWQICPMGWMRRVNVRTSAKLSRRTYTMYIIVYTYIYICMYIIVYVCICRYISLFTWARSNTFMYKKWLAVDGLQVARRLGLAPQVGDEAWLGPCHAAKTTRWKPETNRSRGKDLFQYIN